MIHEKKAKTPEQEDREAAVRSAVPVGKIVTLILAGVYAPALGLMIPWLTWYEGKLDDRYLRKDTVQFYTADQADERFVSQDEVLTLSEARDLQRAVEETGRQQKVNTMKLIFIERASAQSAVTSLREEVAYLEEQGKPTAKMEARLEAAIEYRDCLMQESGSRNCDPLRP